MKWHFKMVLYPFIDIVVAHLQIRFAGLNEIRDSFNCMLNLRSVSKDEISIGAIQLEAEFDDINSAGLINQIIFFLNIICF